MSLVYEPAEDSLLLLRHVEERVSGSMLDMGTGNGVHAIAAAMKPEVTWVVAVDINPDAIEEAKRRAAEAGVSGKIEFLVSDLFQGLTGGGFDWIVFNPPYLPSEGEADEASWSGGLTGGEVIERFLSGAAGCLNAGGGILLVYSTLTGLDLGRLEEGYRVEALEELPLFFEKLLCLLLRPLNPS